MHQHKSNLGKTGAALDMEPYQFLLSTQKTLLRVDEVGALLACGKDTIYKLIDQGELEAHQGAELRSHHKVTSRSVLCYLAKTAKYNPHDLSDVVFHLIKKLSLHDRQTLIEEMKKLQS